MDVEHEAGLELARKLVAVENERNELRTALIVARQQLLVASGLVQHEDHRESINRAIELADDAIGDYP